MSTRPAVGVPRRSRAHASLLRGPLMLVAPILALLAAFVVASWAAVEVRYANHVLPGVQTLGVGIGASSREAAQATLARLAADYNAQWLTLRHGDRTWSAALGDLGLHLDADRTLETALAYGRQGSVLQQLGDRWRGWREGVSLTPALAFDGAHWDEVMAGIAAVLDQPARDARLVVERDARFRVEPAVEGRSVNALATLTRLQSALAAGRPSEVELVVTRLHPSITEADWGSAQSVVATMLRAPVTLAHEGRRWELSPAELAAAVVPVAQLRGGAADPQIRVNQGVLRSLVARVAGEINQAPRNATLEIQNGKVVVVRGAVGQAVDVDATASRVEQALGRPTDRVAAVAVREVLPALTSQEMGPAKERAERALGRPIVLTLEGKRWTISAAALAGMATFAEVERSGKPDVAAGLEANGLRKALERIAYSTDRPARNARFEIRGNQVVAIEPAREGLAMDLDHMVAAVSAAIHADERTVPVRMAVAKPQVTEADGAKFVGRELIMDASTVYGGTLPARMYNIELAARRLNGTLVPPGEVYSFNQALGPATLSNGFKVGYGIILKDGQPETVPSDAGGICQVATTLFQAVFWGGYTFEERNWHLYWIPRYGQPPRGRQGLDATVDDAYGVDFQFRNNTASWLLVQASTDGNKITFRLYGTKPGWEVKVDGPTIANVVKANTEIVEQLDPKMPVGQRVQIESAFDGFTARFVRTVVRDGQVVDRWTAASSYIPSRNVVLVGPEPAPEPTPGEEAAGGAPVDAKPAPQADAKPDAKPSPAPQPRPAAGAQR